MPTSTPPAQPLGTHLGEPDLLSWLSGTLAEHELNATSTHLQACPACQSVLQQILLEHRDPAAVDAFYPERRSQIRRQVNDPAMLRLLNPFDVRPLEVCILDVSKGGAKLRVPERIAVGSIVQLRLSELVCLAEVRYGIEVDGTFTIGIRIDDAFPLPTHATRKITSHES